MMTRTISSRISDDLETLFGAGALGQLSDADLLARFLRRDEAEGSEAAFSELLARHAPMVMGVCKRVLADSQIAADAFQAVFLVLVRKAPAVRVDDSLGRWLYGVSVRVARRARRNALAARGREKTLTGFDRSGGAAPSEACERAELRTVIDQEIARLPVHYRSAVVLCYLEGMTQEQAARRLCCPVGTVESRLHRARLRLRSRLARRGLAPAVGILAWLSDETARAHLPPWLASETTAAAVRCSIDGALGGAVSAAAWSLVSKTSRSMMMVNGFRVASMLLAVGLPTAAAVALSRADDSQAKKAAAAVALAAGSPRTEPTMAERFAKIKAEYDAQQEAVSRAIEKASNQREINAIYTKLAPDEVAFTRRMIDLATSAPKDPAARDALVWVVDKPGIWKVGEYGDEFARAVELLVRHHGDDPEAVRVGLSVDNIVSHHSDALVTGFYAAAKGHEAKGLARLALAQYLEEAAKFTAASRQTADRRKNRYLGVMGDDGKLYDKEVEQSAEEYAYVVELRLRDPEAMRAFAERLYSEVVAECGDVLHRTVKHRELEALLKSPEPKWNGRPLTPDHLAKLKEYLGRKRTLAQEAEGRLDDMQNLVPGKPAPEISGVDFDGKPLKLSDYRGKVVVLVFWGTWCGPCMREVPHERELAERLKDKPFAVLGVNCDDDKQAAASAIKSERMTWPNWYDGAAVEGPIAKRYHIRSYPTLFVIDGQGIIRHKQAIGTGLDMAVDALLKETQTSPGAG